MRPTGLWLAFPLVAAVALEIAFCGYPLSIAIQDSLPLLEEEISIGRILTC